jgi:hypothetical protein
MVNNEKINDIWLEHKDESEESTNIDEQKPKTS